MKFIIAIPKVWEQVLWPLVGFSQQNAAWVIVVDE
jgi:hypothetical protein